jgi:hypothetical protein
MQAPEPRRSGWLNGLAGVAGVAASLWLGYLVMRIEPPLRPSASSLPSAPVLEPCTMTPDGYLRGRLRGSTDIVVDWSGPSLACAGNARPGGAGLRLFFAGRTGAGEDRLVLVIGLDADITGLAGRELPASVTLIDEASSQFFHTSGGRCFTSVDSVAPLAAGSYTYRVEGRLYCAGAIAAVAGERSVTLGDIAYAGRLALDPS